jgi:uncharacterized membrane protein
MTGRTIKWILLVSLLANVLLVGLIIGKAGRGHPFAMMDRLSIDRPVRDKDDRPSDKEAARQLLRDAFAAERPAMEKAVADIRAARAQSIALVRAETLDTAALDASLAQLRLASDAALASFHRSVATAAVKLDTQHRGVLARILERAPGRGPPRGRGHD